MGIKGWLGRTWLLWVLLGAYYLLLAVKLLASPSVGRSIDAVLPAFAGVLIVLGLAMTAWAQYRRDGLERQVLLEATCVAFLVTVVAGVFLDAPWTYDVGIAAWLITSGVRTRQLVR